MKKFLLLMAMGLMTASAYADVKVEVKGFSTDTLVVQRVNLQGNRRVAADSVIVMKEGKAVLPDVAKTMCLFIGPKERSVRPASVYINPGENFEVTIVKGENPVIKGSVVQDMINEVKNRQNDIIAKAQNVDDAVRDSLYGEYAKVAPDYARQNLDTPITLWALWQCDTETAEELLPKIGDNARNSMFGELEQALAKRIEREKQRAEAQKLTAEGMQAPDFSLNHPDGSAFVLSSMRGMWVVLDFWGSWCSWCIKGMPEMKKSYEKYGDSMEIVSIACGDSKEAWLAAIKKYDMNWTNVLSADVIPGSDKKVEQLYGIEGYPTKIIIDPKGKIVKRFVGETPLFYEALEELIK